MVVGPASTLSTIPEKSSERPAPFGIPEIVFSALILLLVAIRLFQEYWAFLREPGGEWNASEWMIDYAAGFVRRGLSGEVLARLMHLTGLGFFPLWATSLTTVYLGLCWYFLRRCRRLGGSSLWRFCLLLNPALLLFPVECWPDGSFLRKEVLFVSATALLVSLCEHGLRKKGKRPLAAALPVLLTVCVVSTLLALIHEGLFLFCWLPLNFAVVLALLLRLRIRLPAAFMLAVSALLPALVVVAASVHWHGDDSSALAICQSWHALSVPTICPVGGELPPALNALGWSLAHNISTTEPFAWMFPTFLALAAFVAAIEIAAIRRLNSKARLSQLLALLALPLLAAFPLFVIGCDWGRYLFVVMGQQFFVMLSDELRPAVFDLLPEGIRGFFERVAEGRLGRGMNVFALRAERTPLVTCVVLLMVPIPVAMGGKMMLRPNPAVIVYKFMRQAREPGHADKSYWDWNSKASALPKATSDGR